MATIEQIQKIRAYMAQTWERPVYVHRHVTPLGAMEDNQSITGQSQTAIPDLTTEQEMTMKVLQHFKRKSSMFDGDRYYQASEYRLNTTSGSGTKTAGSK